MPLTVVEFVSSNSWTAGWPSKSLEMVTAVLTRLLFLALDVEIDDTAGSLCMYRGGGWH